MSNNLPTSTPGESINIAPEYLEIANAYLQSQDVVKVASDLGLEVDFVSAALARREVRAYVNTVFFDVGFNNRGRMRSAMDAILRKKFQESGPAQTFAGTTRAAFTKTNCATSRPTTSWPTPRSISPTGAATACATMCAGNSAYRRWATPTTPGSSTSTTTLHRTARRAWCWPTAR